MATQKEWMAGSQLEGADLWLLYDDAHAGTVADPFVGNGFIASVSGAAIGPMKVHIVDTANRVYNFNINPNLFNQETTIPPGRRLQGVLTPVANHPELPPTIDWGIAEGPSISFSKP